MMDTHDRKLVRCRRLGHEVPFGYCRVENGREPCRLILDCWWEQFDVRAFLRENLSEEEMAKVEKAAAAPPPSKAAGLVEIIRQAREYLKSEE